MSKLLNTVLLAILLVFSFGVVSATFSDSLNIGIEENIPQCDFEDWSCVLTECNNGIQTWICTPSNPNADCSIDSRPSNHGEQVSCNIQQNPPSGGGGGGSSGGGGGGGGGSSRSSGGGGGATVTNTDTSTSSGSDSCTESWVCGEWSNVKESCGTRECKDANNCGTELLKPATSEECPFISFTWITAAVSGVTDFAKSGRGSTVVIIFALLLAGIIIFMVRKYKTKNKDKQSKK